MYFRPIDSEHTCRGILKARGRPRSMKTDRTVFLSITLLLMSIFLSLALTSTTSAAPPGNASDWTLKFSDEFDGASLDLAKWETVYISGDRTNNDELEWYVDDADQHVVSDGTLKLIAKKESVSGHSYTSGLISSHASFSQTYGYWESRMRLPKGKGLWPAFWTLPTPQGWPPEIDIMENLGNQPNKVYMTNHWGTESNDQQYSTSYTGPDFSAGFHVFGMEWSSSSITWYVDGVQRARSTSGVPTCEMHTILNLAVGGSWPGSPDSSTVLPAQLEIDYIRVYKRSTSAIRAAITAPAERATVSGNISVNVSASADLGVAKVDLNVDDLLVASDTIAPYSFYLNTKTMSNGNHTLQAIVTDAGGNSKASADVTVTVSNVAADSTAPTVTITSPSNGSTVSSSSRSIQYARIAATSRYITITATAKDNDRVKQVRLFVDDNFYGGANCNASTYSARFSWNISGVTKGWHTISCDATDASGNTGVSTPLVLYLR